MESLTLQPIVHIEGTINLPGSKSVSNRALLLAALAKGKTRLTNLLDSDDIRHMLNALTALGVQYQLSNNNTVCDIEGLAGSFHPQQPLELFLGNAGTAMRPLAAALSLGEHDIVLTGEPRMKERPIGHLVDALRQGGAKIDYLEQTDYPPLRVCGGFSGGSVDVDGTVSSQFLTALLMMAPLAQQDTTLGKYLVEGDASSASYFLAAAAIKGGIVRVTGIGKNSLQGDIHFASVLEKMGATIRWGDDYIECERGKLKGIDMDMNTIPDAAMTIATTALFAEGETTIRNIYNWRVKETDRLSAMATELRKVGAMVDEGRDYLTVIPPKQLTTAEIKTYNDHRIAMCFSLVALSNMPITILDPGCTAKTFPDYFEKLASISHAKV